MSTLAIRAGLKNEAILMTSAVAVIKRLWRVAACRDLRIGMCEARRVGVAADVRRLRLIMETIKEQQESELINSAEYGLLAFRHVSAAAIAVCGRYAGARSFDGSGDSKGRQA